MNNNEENMSVEDLGFYERQAELERYYGNFSPTPTPEEIS